MIFILLAIKIASSCSVPVGGYEPTSFEEEIKWASYVIQGIYKKTNTTDINNGIVELEVTKYHKGCGP